MSASDRTVPDDASLEPEALYHLVTAEEWEACRADAWIRPASLGSEGFIHCSWGHQVPRTVARHFAGVSVTALRVDVERIGDVDLVEEDSYGSGEAFPHLYGPVPLDAVVGRCAVS